MATVSLVGAASAAAQERPYTAEPPVVSATTPPPLPIEPTRREDRIEYTRPPDVIAPSSRQPVPAPPRASVITNPRWYRAPLPEYPEQAVAAGVESGRVTLSCIIRPDGFVTDCEVHNETPPGRGFAESALAATARARVSPGTVDGAAVGARVTFTVRFQMPPREPAPAPGA